MQGGSRSPRVQRRRRGRLLAFVLAVGVALAGSAVLAIPQRVVFYPKYWRTDLGMSRDEVIAALGSPSDAYTIGQREGLSYHWWRDEGDSTRAVSWGTWRDGFYDGAVCVGFDSDDRVVYRSVGCVL